MKLSHLRGALVCMGAIFSFAAHSQNNLPQLGKDAVDDVVKAMMLEGKASKTKPVFHGSKVEGERAVKHD